ncbi:MAG: choice-of-anchor D domain-containing protein [Gemmatimonadetes bacterium]|nr:choice-of-anchor D domain-containing protein [Gemmatimonadota bacterium]MYB55024.1 choice-of-anchor D domain-containing protein [Gemmatimonadota bacterium]
MLTSASGVSATLGTRNEDILVIDQGGILRLRTTAIATGSAGLVNAQVDALLNKTPVISLFPSEIYFGRTLEVGQSKTVEFKIENTGAGPLEITGYSAPEGITMEPSTLTIAPGESKTVQITLTPMQAGTFSGKITLQHGEQSVGTLEIPVLDLTIEASPLPIISLIQENLSLGEIEMGRGITTTFTITNTGTGPLNITDIQSDIVGIALSETQLTVPPGQSQDITITFNPPAPGPITGTIDIISNDPEKASISLTITGSAIFIPADPRTDFNGSLTVDFYDFLLFSEAFGTANTTFDLDGSGTVDFPDFLIFVASFGKAVNG